MSAVEQGKYGVYAVELTDEGFRIRHGRYGGLGQGVWASRFKAGKAAWDLAHLGEIRPENARDRPTQSGSFHKESQS